MLFMLQRELPAADLLGALLAFRLIYYLLPLALAAIVLGLHELRHYRERVLWLLRAVEPWASMLLPHVRPCWHWSVARCCCSRPRLRRWKPRLEWLQDLIPLSVLEISHFISSLVGMACCCWRDLQRRLDAALAAGRGFPGRRHRRLAAERRRLTRKPSSCRYCWLVAAVPTAVPSPCFVVRRTLYAGWLAAIAVVLLCSIWLGLFSYKHVEYSNALWWDFSFSHRAERRVSCARWAP